ncbi:MAG: hypothetical protein KGM99_16330, partial [Burkholderiales bacterium]|nr:hypothetical protein [Burkholderiales bacterium]
MDMHTPHQQTADRNNVAHLTRGQATGLGGRIQNPARWHAWRRCLPSRFFLLIGEAHHGPHWSELLSAVAGTDMVLVVANESQIAGAGTAVTGLRGVSNVYLLGRISEQDRLALLSLCFCLLFPYPSLDGIKGAAWMDGAAFALPMLFDEATISISYTPMAEETGMLVNVAEPGLLRAAMQMLWSDGDYAKNLGWHASQRFQTVLAAESMARSYRQSCTQRKSQSGVTSDM